MRTLRRRWQWLVLAALLVLGGRFLYRALASDVTKIRWCIEAMVDGFNDRHMSHVMEGIAPEYRDARAHLSAEELHQVLLYAFLREVDRDGHFLLRAALDLESLDIVVHEDRTPTSATVALRIGLRRTRAAGEELLWDAHVTGELEQRDEGWQWTHSEVNHEDLKRSLLR